MKVYMIVEDRDTAYLILDVDSFKHENQLNKYSLSFEGLSFEDIEIEGTATWMEWVGNPSESNKLKVVPFKTVDWDGVYDSDWCPIPTPIVLLNNEEYKRRYEV